MRFRFRIAFTVLAGVFLAGSLNAQTPEIKLNQTVQKAYEVLRPVLVRVKAEVLEDPASRYEDRLPVETVLDEFVRQKIPLHLCGIRIAPNGTVLVRDPNLPIARYGKVELTSTDGHTIPAKIDSVLENYAAILFVPMEPLLEPLPYALFSPTDMSIGKTFLIAQPAFLEETLALRIEEAQASATLISNPKDPTIISWWSTTAPNATPIILDNQSQVIGVALDNALWQSTRGNDSWIGTHIVEDRRLTQEMLDTIAKKLVAGSDCVREIEVTFRNDSQFARQLQLERGKLFLYGIVMSATGTIMVPCDLDRNAVQQIQRIAVRDSDRLLDAEFVGLFRELGAFLLQVKELPESPARFAPNGVARGQVFYTLKFRRRYSRRFVEVEYNRYLDEGLGYRERRYPIPQKPLRVGDMIADEEGRFIGFFALSKADEEEQLRSKTETASARQTERKRLFLFSEVLPLIENPKDHIIVGARPMTRREERGLVWLGVEFQPMNPGLAHAFGVEGPTRDGARGLLVTDIYPASPAERLGIKARDVLLSISVIGTPSQFDLMASAASEQAPKRMAAFRFWRPRRNYLTQTLTLIGEGRHIAITALQEGKETVIPLVLEKAPDDFDSADTYKDTALGISVRPVTYEVRHILKLSDNTPGLVISDVESGGKAGVGQVRPRQIITKVNNEPIATTQDFERLVKEGINRGKVELLITVLGRSRILDLEFETEPSLD